MCGGGAVTATRPRTFWVFVLPALLFYVAFVVWPIAQSLGMSVGGGHYARLIADPRFWLALSNTLLLVVLSLAIQLPAAMGLAVLLCGRLPGRGVFRTVYFAPVVVPTAAVGFLWKFLYAPAEQQGLLNGLLAALGLGPVDWLGSPGVDLLAIVIVVSWRYIGFHTVIFMAGLESIPQEVYEAARIDGASAWETFVEVTLPMMRRVIAVSATLSIIGSLKYFDIFYIMSPGGGTDGSADLVTTYMYRTAFRANEFGYASALAVVLLLLTVAVAVPAMRLLHGRSEA